MQLLIAGIVLFLIFLYVSNKYKQADPKDILYSMRWVFVGAILLFVLFLVATGKVQLIWLAFLSLLPWVKRFFMAKNIYKTFKRRPPPNDKTNHQNKNQSSSKDKNFNNSGPMDKLTAYDILGLRPGASEKEIQAAHRTLMKKHHPDAGGDAEIAAQINQAKDTLLS